MAGNALALIGDSSDGNAIAGVPHIVGLRRKYRRRLEIYEVGINAITDYPATRQRLGRRFGASLIIGIKIFSQEPRAVAAQSAVIDPILHGTF